MPLQMTGMPTLRCTADNGCGRFFQFCPNCHRLHALHEQSCRTARCKQHALSEPYALFESANGDATHGGSVGIPAAWVPGKAIAFDGYLTMPASLGGLSFRYGKLCFAGENRFSSIAANRRSRARLDDRAAEVKNLDLPTRMISGGSLLPHPHALRLAHGVAYLLCENGPVRVDFAKPGKPEIQPASPSAWQDASESSGWDDWGDDAGGFGADSFTSADSSIGATPKPLDISAVRWQMQAATPNRWLGLGDEQGNLCLVESPQSSALFEISRIESPGDARSADVVDIMSLGEEIFLVLCNNVWSRRAGKWEIFWQGKTEFFINGVLQYGNDLILWGRENDAIVLHRVDFSARIIGQPMSFKARDVYTQPVRLGSRLFFFDHTPDDHSIVIFDLEQPLLAPQRITFVSNSRAVWAAGGECDGRAWLVYALDDGTCVEFFVMAVAPTIEKAHPIGSKLSVRRGERGGSLAAVIADGHLAIAAVTSQGAALHLFDMNGATT